MVNNVGCENKCWLMKNMYHQIHSGFIIRILNKYDCTLLYYFPVQRAYFTLYIVSKSGRGVETTA